MPGDLTEFAAKLRLTAGRCDEAAADGVMHQLQEALTDVVRPLAMEVKDGLTSYVPNRYAGVLREDLAITATETSSGTTVRSEVRASTTRKRRAISRLDQLGRLNHPLFGDKKHWYGQSSSVKAGFFTKPLRRAKPRIKQKLAEALERAAEQVAE